MAVSLCILLQIGGGNELPCIAGAYQYVPRSSASASPAAKYESNVAENSEKNEKKPCLNISTAHWSKNDPQNPVVATVAFQQTQFNPKTQLSPLIGGCPTHRIHRPNKYKEGKA